MISDMLEVQNLLLSHGIIISFSGKLTQELIVEYGEAVRTYLETNNRPRSEAFHIFSIFIEQTQNITHYCATKADRPRFEEIDNSNIVTIGKNERGSYICSGNLVENADIESLKQRIESLAGLNKEELKALYKKRLREEPSSVKSAGLGLIDMARKSAEPLAYSVVKQDEQLSFFMLKAIV